MKTETKGKHTPGPWNATYAIENDDGTFTVKIVNNMTGGDSIAEVTYRGQENVEADARLIAAAPELLEVCKKLLKTFNDDVSDAFKVTERDKTYYQAEQVIRKAEGWN